MILLAPPSVNPGWETVNPSDYPIYSLPGAIRDMVLTVQTQTQAPHSLVACSALAAAATVCQGIADVQIPTLQKTKPLSLNFLIVADSGERKTATDSFLFEPIYKFGRYLKEEHAIALEEWSIHRKISEEVMRGIKHAIKKNAERQKPTNDLKAQLIEQIKSQAPEPKLMRLTISDATSAALAIELAKNPCTAVLHSNEGSDVLSGNLMGNLSLLNRIWDGQSIEVDRANKKYSFSVQEARLTTCLAVQPNGYRKLCLRDNGNARNSGYLARTLIAVPVSNMGNRMLHGHQSPIEDYPAYQDYRVMMNTLLEQSFDRHKRGMPRKIMTLSKEAKTLWENYYNKIESMLSSQGGYLNPIKDFGAKASEHVLRLAAVFQVMSDGVTNIENTIIEEMYVESASVIVDWHLKQFDMDFGQEGINHRLHRNAMELLQWLRGRLNDDNSFLTEIKYSDIRRYCPGHLRDKEKLDPILAYLTQSMELQMPYIGKRIYRLGHVMRFSAPQSNWSPIF